MNHRRFSSGSFKAGNRGSGQRPYGATRTMARYRPHGRRGFTLIEVIAAMVIVSLMVSMAGMGIVMGIRGYVLAKENAHMAQKAQLAMARLTLEMRALTDVVAEDFSTSAAEPYLIYDRADGRYAVDRKGDAVRLYELTQGATSVTGTGNILIDSLATDSRALNITFFQDKDQDRKHDDAWVPGVDPIENLTRIELSLALKRSDVQVQDFSFSTSVYPRSR